MTVQTVFASAARTATPTAFTFNTRQATGLQVVIRATAATATPSVVPSVLGYDPLSANYWAILTGAPVTEGTLNQQIVLTVFPGGPTTANLSVNAMLPDVMQIRMTHGDSDSITYSVALHLLRAG